MKTNKGVTLMEFLVAIGILTIVASMTFYFFAGFRGKMLDTDAAGLSAFLREARLLSIASKNASPFGIHLESDGAVLFQGNTYIAGGANQKHLKFARNVYLHSYALDGGGQDIVFNRLTGATSDFGDITLSLKDDSASTTITVLRTGVVK